MRTRQRERERERETTYARRQNELLEFPVLEFPVVISGCGLIISSVHFVIPDVTANEVVIVDHVIVDDDVIESVELVNCQSQTLTLRVGGEWAVHGRSEGRGQNVLLSIEKRAKQQLQCSPYHSNPVPALPLDLPLRGPAV